MKKVFFFSVLVASVLMSLAMTTTDTKDVNNVEIVNTGDYYLKVHVSYPSGSNYSGAKVAGEVCGLLGGMTKTVYTDSDGYATLYYSTDESLCKIFVKGETNKGKWRSGETAYFTAR